MTAAALFDMTAAALFEHYDHLLARVARKAPWITQDLDQREGRGVVDSRAAAFTLFSAICVKA